MTPIKTKLMTSHFKHRLPDAQSTFSETFIPAVWSEPGMITEVEPAAYTQSGGVTSSFFTHWFTILGNMIQT
ncbi:hypothetical protein N7533_001692 [Penicillium manginii]|uniref:uncharacterized protein n=1 Tax=Penicillium manginii TaxID=203109 RepID=UPI0025482124|nr:uncharacterized protein N7533_001692 [Penicillium manginii]KAJ5763011.1 hypothetical protein N7533_001692 [Penicillium manginii]